MNPKTLEQYANTLRYITSGGAGAGATATAALLTTGAVRSATINAAGTGYSVDDVLTVDAGNDDATFTVVSIGPAGAVTEIVKTTSGTGYVDATGAATVVAPTGGTGCKLNIVAEFAIDDVTVDEGGAGYIQAAVLAPGAVGDTPATFAVTVAAGEVTVITPTGGGYRVAPTLTILPRGPATGAALITALETFDASTPVKNERLREVLEDGIQQVVVPGHAVATVQAALALL